MRRSTSAAAAAAALAFAQPAAADTVSDWWDYATRVAQPYQSAGAPKTPDQERTVSRVALAMFEALNAIDRRYESYLGFQQGDARASQDAAAATAAYRVLLHHWPAKKTELEESYSIAMSAIAAGAPREAGVAIGEAAAKAAMDAGGIDPAIVQTPYRPHAAPGDWTATALPTIEPSTMAFRRWAIASAQALRSPPPPALTSERWARDYDEVKRLGGRANSERTPHQTLMARYRIGPDVGPAMRAAAGAPGRTPVQNARMFALHHMAVDDAVVAMSEAKMHYNFWRPITAIRNAEADGNPATAPDPAWLPLLPTPNFPEYPCGHCTYAGAIAEVMKAETGPRPRGGVKVGTMMSASALVQTLPGWDEWVQEVSDSRIYAGAHYRFANEAGEAIGREAAKAVLAKAMRPLPSKRR